MTDHIAHPDSTTGITNKLHEKKEDREFERKQRRYDRRFELASVGRADIRTVGDQAAASGGVPGAASYNGIDHMPTNTRTHRKTFMFDLHARDFNSTPLKLIGQKPGAPQGIGLVAPFYHFPWQYLFWYLDSAELGFYRRCNFSKVKESRFRINIVGFRTPFTTNNTSSSVANSMVDMRCDLFKGIEKIHPFRSVATPDGASKFSELNSIEKVAAFFTGKLKTDTDGSDLGSAFGSPLYGLSVYNTPIADQTASLGANQRSVNYYLQPMFTRTNFPTHGAEYEDMNNLYIGWPAFAHIKSASVDLKQFSGPLTEVVYTPRNGIINMTGSVLSGFHLDSDTKTSQYLSMVRKSIMSSKLSTDQNEVRVPGAAQISEVENQLGFSYAPKDNAYAINPKEHSPNSTNQQFLANVATVEGPFYTTRHEWDANVFESILLGIRPTYNGSTIQEGILSIEVETEIDIEYQLNWPNQSEWTNNATLAAQKYSLLGNTNDQDLMIYSGQQSLPSYGHGGKQVQHIVQGYTPN